MTNTIRQDRPQRPMNPTGIGGQGWLGSLRWAPREFRDWVAQGGIRIEECREVDSLVIRAELPGVDPLTATFDNGLLNVQVPLAGTDGPEVREIPVLAKGGGDGNNGSGGA